MAAPQTIYRFGLFEADPAIGRLSREGRTIRLQEQPFQLLITLLQADGGLVTREELRQRLWHEDTFVEFDKSLGVAVAKLRAALGDDAANPRFIETIPRRGYRFIAPVRVVPATPASIAVGDEPRPTRTFEAESTAPPATAGPAQPPVIASKRRRRLWAAAIVVLAAGVIASLWVWRDIARARLGERAAIVVGAFANTTGDAVFDGALRGATMIGLAQSPYVHVLPDATLGELLQGLGHPPDEPLTPGLGRELCQRARAAAIIEGSIRQSGADYVMAIDASRCDGTSLARESASIARKDQIIPTLGREIEALRRRFGESRASLQAFNAPIELATTDSLDALRAYQLGMDLRAHADNLKAIPALQTAIALDPQFAVAYAQLGSSYSNMGNVEQGTPFFRKAFELRSRATAPERLYITGRYYDIVTGDLEKASETYREWSETYPDDWRGFNALANDANLMGRYDVAASASGRTIALQPNHAFGYVNLLTALVSQGRFDDVKAACARTMEHFPDSGAAHLILYSIAGLQGDAPAMAREVAWSDAHGREILYTQAEYAGFRGRPAESARLFEEVARIARAQGNAESPGNVLAVESEYSAMLGRTNTATEAATAALQVSHNQVVLGLAAIANALAGRDRAAEQLVEELDRRFPLSTMTLGVYAPMTRTILAASGRDASAADVTHAFSPAVPYEWGQESDLALPYVRGIAMLQIHAWPDAADTFQQVIDHVGVDPVSPIYPLAYLGLARADAALGRADESRRAYARVLDAWKDAEPDFALLSVARREAAAAGQ